jgi:histidinol-phosphatase (PHP family)
VTGRRHHRRFADLHTHTVRCGHACGRDEEYVEAAIARSLTAIAITDHLPLYWLPRERQDPRLAMAPDELPRYIDAVLALKERFGDRIEVLLGIEADYVAGHEERLARLLATYPFDVVLGSVHWLDDWWVDAPSSLARYRCGQREVDRIWAAYAERMLAAVRSRLFDVIAHLDLPKKFGFRASGPPAELFREVLETMAESGCAFELSSAGRRRPVGEDYPSPDLLAALVAAGVPCVLSSDAHAPVEVGFAFAELATTLAACGRHKIGLFRHRRWAPLVA